MRAILYNKRGIDNEFKDTLSQEGHVSTMINTSRIGLLLALAVVSCGFFFTFFTFNKFSMHNVHCFGNQYNYYSWNTHRMKILLSVNWNISECPLNAHGMFTEIRISGTVQWPFSKHSVPLNAAEWQAHFSDHSVIFFYFQIQKKFHQIRGF